MLGGGLYQNKGGAQLLEHDLNFFYQRFKLFPAK